jgi:signal transduction histidine kinase
VEKYSGKITFESNIGGGTTFIITLPAADSPTDSRKKHQGESHE